MKPRTMRESLALSALLVLPSARAAEDYTHQQDRTPGRISLGTGFEYSTGDYGSPDGSTDDWYVPLSVGYSRSNWRVKVSIPYIRSTGPGNVLSAGDTRVVIDQRTGECVRTGNSGSGSSNSGSGSSNSGSGSSGSNSGSGSSNSGSGSSNSGSSDDNDCTVTTTTTTTVITTPGTSTVTRETVEGFGDLTLAATYSFDPFRDWAPYVDLGFKVKVPTANHKLSTGAYDYTLRTDLYRPFGKFALFGGVGYTFKGDIEPTATSSGVQLDDTLLATMGGEYRIAPSWLTGIAADYKQAASRFSVDAWDLSGYVTWRAIPNLNLTGTLGTGFTAASPDFVGGLSIVYGFNAPF